MARSDGTVVGTGVIEIFASMRGSATDLTAQVNKQYAAAGEAAGKTFETSTKAGINRAHVATAAATVALVQMGRKALAEADEAQKVGATTEQLIRSTGGAAGVSAEQVGDYAEALSVKIGVDDEAIQSSQNMLLAFEAVKNQVGEGANIFDRATTAGADLAATGFGSLESNAKLFGKALSDPVKGLSLLTRAGVVFTDGQKEQVRALVASGKQLEAQKLILDTVEKKVGGVAAASATGMEKMRVAIDNAFEAIGEEMMPNVERAAAWVTTQGAPMFAELGTSFVRIADNAAPLVEGVGDLVGIFSRAPAPIQQTVLALAGLHKVGVLGPLAGGARSFFGGIKSGAAGAAAEVGLPKGRVGLAGRLSGVVGMVGGAGPWGLALTAGVTALGLFASASRDAGAAQEEMEAAAKVLAETLDPATGKIQQRTIDMAIEQLNDVDTAAGKAAKSLQDSGVAKQDVIEAYLGDPAKLQAVTARWKAELAGFEGELATLTSRSTSSRDARALNGQQISDLRVEIAKRRELIAPLEGNANELIRLGEQKVKDTEISKRLADTYDIQTTAVEGATTAVDTQGASVDVLAGAHLGLAASVQQVWEEQRRLAQEVLEANDAFTGARGSSRNYRDAVRDLEESLGKAKGKPKRFSAEWDTLNAALDRTAVASLGQAEAQLAAGGDIDKVKAQVKAAREEFVEHAVAIGYDRGEANRLATQMGLTGESVDSLNTDLGNLPASVTPKVDVDTAAAATKVATLATSLLNLGLATFTPFINLGIGGPGKAAVPSVKNRYRARYEYAAGTDFHPGDLPALVGEDGPEMVWLPRGAAVSPAAETARALPALAAAAATGPKQFEGDVYLDEQKVGRVLGRRADADESYRRARRRLGARNY